MAVSVSNDNATMIRRETHSSRAGATVVVTLVLMALAVYLCAEVIASLSGSHLLIPAAQLWQRILTGDIPQAVLISVGIGAILVGLFLIAKAFGPGRFNRHAVSDDRIAIVVDDAVIASSTSRAVREQLHLDPAQVSTSVRRSAVHVNIIPTSGEALERGHVEQVVGNVVTGYGLADRVKTGATIAQQGVVNS